MFRIWAEIWNASETEIYGIVDLVSCTYQRRLDMAGMVSITVAGTDPIAVGQMSVGRWVHVYWDAYGKRLICKAQLLSKTLGISAGAIVSNWQATDVIEELRQKNTLRGLIYNDDSIEDVVRDLVDRAGWGSVLTGIVGNTTQRFDGVSILQALSTVATMHGYHFRLDSDRVLLFGALGDDSGVWGLDAQSYSVGVGADIALIERLDVVQNGHEIVNWIEPISGPIDGGLTLKRSTKSSPYTIQTTTGPNGQTVYYLADATSISAYGQREQVWSPELLVAPVVATTTSLINAADVLYDAAAAFLTRHKDPLSTYRAGVRNLQVDVLPGDKVHLSYKGQAYHYGEVVEYVDLDADFWVMGVQDSYTANGHTVNWELGSIDEWPATAVDMVAKVVRGARVGSYQRQLNNDRSELTDEATISFGEPLDVVFEIQSETVDVPSCVITVERVQIGVLASHFTLQLDGVTIAGGPWLTSQTAPHSFTFNIADLLMESASVQGAHTLTIECLYGQGDITTRVVLVETLLPGIGVPLDPFGDRV